jgi:hypothetical protein
VATFTHATPERCAQLGRALTAAGLTWSDNGRQDDPSSWTTPSATRTAARGASATNFQISPSSPGQIWEASCSALMTTTPILSARQHQRPLLLPSRGRALRACKPVDSCAGPRCGSGPGALVESGCLEPRDLARPLIEDAYDRQ